MKATPSQQAVFTLLYDNQVTSTPASGTIANVAEESNADLKLNKNEVAEIKYIEVETPLSSTGTAEALEYLRPIIDGKDYQGGDLLRLRADNDSLIPIPKSRIAHTLQAGMYGSRVIFDLGLTLPELVSMGVDQNQNLILENTTIKTREAGKINFKYEIGNAAITDNFRVKAYGVRYTDLDVANIYVQLAYGGGRRVSISDPRNGRSFSTVINPNFRDSRNDFTKLIGGNDMDLNGGVTVHKFNYWARNNAATTASKDFSLSFDDGQVDAREQNMDLEIDDQTLWWIRKLGLRAHSNHLDTKITCNDVEVFRERIRDSINNLEFGRVSATSASAEPSDHLYKPLPTIPAVFGHNETLKVLFQDTGSVIADGSNFNAGSLVAWDGLKIVDPNFSVERPRSI